MFHWQGEALSPQYIPFWPHPMYEYVAPQPSDVQHPSGYGYGPYPSRHSLRAAHYSHYTNPYSVPSRSAHPRGNVVRVPATYACQPRNTDSIDGCPIVHARSMDSDYCLYVYDIRLEALYLTYNWLVSLMERYPGYRDLHIIATCRGVAALVGFDNNYHTRRALKALDGFRTNSLMAIDQVLRAKCVHRSIFRYIYAPGFDPERFFLH